eukprot:4154829-Prymnesium_polylepis.2
MNAGIGRSGERRTVRLWSGWRSPVRTSVNGRSVPAPAQQAGETAARPPVGCAAHEPDLHGETACNA